MNSLFTVAYPEIAPADAAFIEALRADHDAHSSRILPALFTLVFACNSVPSPIYLQHVQLIASETTEIKFRCRYAMLSADDKSETSHVFMVPDEGYAAISQLHDRLYSGILAGHLHLDIPYIPHITVAALESRRQAKALRDLLNKQGIHVEGALRAITAGSVENGVFANHASFPMRV